MERKKKREEEFKLQNEANWFNSGILVVFFFFFFFKKKEINAPEKNIFARKVIFTWEIILLPC